ncbi:MAG: MFS transporter [Candidatus Altiarchaeota archaeon]|nr:MFS transporter [Candidatus Altiarchaeota archaeon]
MLLDGDVLKDKNGKSLKYSIKDGAAFSAMTGFGEQYFSPLAIELGASNLEIGMLVSTPQFIAALLQLYTSRVTSYLKSRKKTITLFVLLQALTWLPLMSITLLLFENKILLLILLVTLYFVFGHFIVPVWNSLIGDLVSEGVRGRFFGMRNRINGATAFISLFIAGFLLSLFPKEEIMQGFVLIFSIAFIARLVSWHYLKKSEDPPMKSDKENEFSFIQYLRRLKETNYGRFALYFALMNFSVYIASPFFTVYMLRDLQMPYLEYTIVTASAALTSFLAMTHWGNLADRFGNRRILSFSGMSIVVVPILWLFSKDIIYLIFAQVVSGFVWAGFNLSSMNFVYDNVKPENRTRVFAYHNVLAGVSLFMGSMVGGLLAFTITSSWIFYSSLQVIFLISGLVRGIASLLFLPRLKERRSVEEISSRDFFIRYNGTGPIIGLTYKAVTEIQRSLQHVKRKDRPESRA